MKHPNPFGVRSLVLRNISSTIRNRNIDSAEELGARIDECIQMIVDYKPVALTEYEESIKCDHEFDRSTYTIQERVIGYVTVYERCCSKCGYTESQTVSEDSDAKPEWAVDAQKMYYNNSI